MTEWPDEQPGAELSWLPIPAEIISHAHVAVLPCAAASCREDDGRPVEVGCQEPASNHPKRLSFRVGVVSENGGAKLDHSAAV